MTTPRSKFWERVQPYILAGGLSKRFGSDKSLAIINDQRQIDRLWNALAEDFTRPPILIQRANDNRSTFEYPSIVDQMASRGPLCGIATGLSDLKQRHLSDESLALFVPCDMFRWSRQLFDDLAIAKTHHANLEVALYETASGLQPFPSLWEVKLVNDVHLAANSEERSILRFIQHRNFCAVPLKDSQLIACFNTPEQLAVLKKERS